MALPNSNTTQLVDYKVAKKQPGSAVNLRINKGGFSCAEAGEYTCVVGTNNRTVLVTPIGECGKQCGLGLSCSTRSNASLCWWGAYLHSTRVMYGESACNVAVPASQVWNVVLQTWSLQPAPLVQLALGQTSPSSARQKTQLGQVSRTSSSERKIYLNRFVAQCHASSGSRPTLVQIIHGPPLRSPFCK